MNTVIALLIILTVLTLIGCLLLFRRLEKINEKLGKNIDESNKNIIVNDEFEINKHLKRKDTIVSNEQISEFAIDDEEGNTLLEFKLIPQQSLESKWKQVPIENHDHLKGLMSSLGGATASTALAQWGRSGLFMATAPVDRLMKLSSGGFSTAIKGANGDIVQHAGFVKVGSSIFTPMVAFQLMAIVTGQYYMHGISKQLNAVQNKLDELLILFHIERQAKLRKSIMFLNEFINRKSFEVEDFNLIRSIISDLADIREEYYLMISDTAKEIEKNESNSLLRSLSETKKVINDFKSIGFLEKLNTSIKADELYHFAKIVELHMNLCFKNPSINRLNLIKDNIKEFSNLDIKDFQFKKTEELYEDVRKKLFKRIEPALLQALFRDDEIDNLRTELNKEFNNFECEKRKSLNEIKANYISVTEPFTKYQNIIIDNTDTERPVVYLENNN